ncbi:heat shock protein DnaJ [Gluconobacter thailandicus F149-1 = NBRC 100600]|nr:heat shock protein DnaJ [Gluconobacter frateurii M-2]GAN91860.1 heat shock protein DnaJ [Gluconobacter thailandicus F149-1 = NBRC 100600]GBR59242.1 molecular chaperone DnaJ [Gluconobacter thailandicus F149-1 = NBRC 100600]GEL86359.1 molecular chaperone DnaJ [Gluconobacter thailandicus F149-1 = NBRC 100600]
MERAGYRAPRGREALRSYFWFCLDHVREYNSRWDFYRGMTPGQIEAHLRADTSWQRPSWKLGTGTANKAEFNEEDILDPLDILGASRRNRAERAKETARQRAAASGPPEPLRQPLATLDLSWPVSLDEVKTRYRALARRHHPDANIGDQKAEERFKAIGSAYAVLKTHFSRESEFVS